MEAHLQMLEDEKTQYNTFDQSVTSPQHTGEGNPKDGQEPEF